MKKILLNIEKGNTTHDLSEELDTNKSALRVRILKRIKRGTCTIKTLAHDLGVGERTVEAILAFMVHDGYIEEISYSNTCRLCPMNCKREMLVKMYTLTSKGIKYLKQ